MRNSGADRARDDPTALALSIADDIRARGPISFRDFMERALYEPGRGYYARLQTPWSETADFVTAPQVDASFGTAVARLARECDAALGAPQRFDLVEQGGGDGALIGDVCDALARDADELYRRIRVWCIERGAAARTRQQERLAQHADRVRWLDGLAEIPIGKLEGLLFSNELLDAFPVHRVVRRDGRLRELFVDVRGDELVEREMEPSTHELADYLHSNGIDLGEGQVAEICLAVAPWVAGVAQ
ncbi:MAG: SAM-dependent methyltransferase, partial [Acidobacteriota bacterium]